MLLNTFEYWERRIGAAAALVPLIAIFVGLGRGLRRPAGRVTGEAGKLLQLPVYILIGIPYFGFCVLLWRPLRLVLSTPARIVALILGTLLYFPGLALALWGRLTLGNMYNVSSGFGVQLYADHQLIACGPYAFVRHPIYLGIQIAALGGLFIYRTWTLVFLALNSLGLTVRAHREEQALAAEFGEQWREYCQHVPAWIPRRS